MDVDTEERVSRPMKSWRRKYNKIRVKFRDTAQESVMLQTAELRALKTLQRLKEQNDQIMDLIMDVNESSRPTGSLRFDIEPLPSGESTRLQPDQALSNQPNGRYKLSDLERQFPDFPLARHKEAFEGMRDTRDTTSRFTSYLGLDIENAYLNNVDAAIESGAPLHDSWQWPKPTQLERESEIPNPTSVTDWLRKNTSKALEEKTERPDRDGPGSQTPDVKEKTKSAGKHDAGTSSVPRRSTKRTSLLKQESYYSPEAESGYANDSWDVPPPTTTGKGKRKREDEPYRPKSGNGPRNRKRKSAAAQSAAD